MIWASLCHLWNWDSKRGDELKRRSAYGKNKLVNRTQSMGSPGMDIFFDPTGERTYSFRGLPSQRMSLTFFLEPFDVHEVDRLKSLMTIVNVDLRDESGAVLCAGSGRLLEAASGVAEKGPNDHWTLGSSAVGGYFWRAACNDMRLRHRRSYRLTVKISDADPRTPQVSIRPVLYSADQP
jgi:hypothetical protein